MGGGVNKGCKTRFSSLFLSCTSLSSIVILRCLQWPHVDASKYIVIAISLIRLDAKTLIALAVQKPPREHVLAVLMAADVAAELAVADVAASHIQIRLPAIHAPDTACDLEPHASDA